MIVGGYRVEYTVTSCGRTEKMYEDYSFRWRANLAI